MEMPEKQITAQRAVRAAPAPVRKILPDDEEIRFFLREKIKCIYFPSSVYRLQFNSRFTFRQAVEILPFLRELGIQAVYASPFFAASPGSVHGYDVIDHNQINPEIGSAEDFENYCRALRENGLEQILDVVPNHMGIQGGNPLWRDVLENGPGSFYAHFFDIDWNPKKTELKDKVLIPILSDYYGKVLENQEIQLRFGAEQGDFSIHYWENRLPVCPMTYNFILEYGIEELKKKLPENDHDLLEYLSIITSFRNLPLRSETDPEKIRERSREKGIAKERLAKIVYRSAVIRQFVESRVQLFNGSKAEARSFDLLDTLLNEQAYRMAYWRVASEEINFRRFFDINELAAIRIEEDSVFQFHHQLVFQLIQEGKIKGLRIDHPDGLYDPPAYFRKIQNSYLRIALENKFPPSAALSEKLERILNEEEFQTATPLFVVAEKILDRKESLPENWNVHGTVGYDYLNSLNGLFVDASHEKDFTTFYESLVGQIDFDQLLYDRKKFFALVHMSSEINTLAHRLDQISERNRNFRDFTLNNLTVGIREVIAGFPVYRTYISPHDAAVSARDEKYIHIAIEKAKHRTPALIHAVYDFLRDVLLLRLEGQITPEEKILYRDFVLRFQQLTGPIMAKGLEDTCFYVYNRLVSLNEVGGDPLHFGTAPGDFHQQNTERNKRWPYSFLATSTHDTKRSEDSRMRLNVLSEIPEEWAALFAKWSMVNEKHKVLIGDISEPRRNTEYYIYQTLLGVAPDEIVSPEEHPRMAERLWNGILKSLREAKIHTNWINPNLEYEEAVKKFVFGILSPSEENLFWRVFLPFQKKIKNAGMWNSLSATVLKIGSPGVADLYQGTELWNYALVDPDNRRPVNFALRTKLLSEMKKRSASGRFPDYARELLLSRADGRIKLFILWKSLRFRNEFRDLFIGGDYQPLKASGLRERNVVSFLRKNDGKRAVVVAARFFLEFLENEKALPLGEKVWAETVLTLPKDVLLENLTDIFTGKKAVSREREEGYEILLSEIFRDLPVAILTNG